MSQLSAFTRNDTEVGNRPAYFYETWLQKRYAAPFAVLIMIILAAPMAQTMAVPRRARSAAGSACSSTSWQGICQCSAKPGRSAAVAAWTPGLLFLSFGIAGCRDEAISVCGRNRDIQPCAACPARYIGRRFGSHNCREY
jgi:lipopolysaccharide export LptBFGC system permease protein LptF